MLSSSPSRWRMAQAAATLVLFLSLVGCHANISSRAAKEVIILQPDVFYTMLQEGAFRAVIDVRTRAEWDTGHIENATLVDSLQLANTTDEITSTADLQGCEDCPIVVYCRSGSRAGAALTKLMAAGFHGPLYNGLGVKQWTEAGYPLVKDDHNAIYPSAIPVCKHQMDPATGDITIPGLACKTGEENEGDQNNETDTSIPDETNLQSDASSRGARSFEHGQFGALSLLAFVSALIFREI